jgi:hypothetical protein
MTAVCRSLLKNALVKLRRKCITICSSKSKVYGYSIGLWIMQKYSFVVGLYVKITFLAFLKKMFDKIASQ